MTRGYIVGVFKDARYGSKVAVYDIGQPGAWGGVDARFRGVVRLAGTDNHLLSVTFLPPGTSMDTIRSWYGPGAVMPYVEAKGFVPSADRWLASVMPDLAFVTSSAILLSTMYRV